MDQIKYSLFNLKIIKLIYSNQAWSTVYDPMGGGQEVMTHFGQFLGGSSFIQ